MDEDMNYFAAPASSDAPIVLGPSSDDPFGGGEGGFGGDGGFGDYNATPVLDFANRSEYGTVEDYARGGEFGMEEQAAYLGEINETPTDAPIILGPPTDLESEPLAPTEPVGPTPMQIWNDEWQEILKQRKDEENARKAELVEESRTALEQFHLEREQRREAIMAKNREDEQAKLEAIEADLENDNSWQRVCKMIDMSHDNQAEAKDVKRMRDTLIFLKNDTSKAATLSA
jgi:Clathrin light chain